MKKNIILLIASLLTYYISNGQITKGNFLVGGNASFSSLKSSSTATVQFKQTDIQVTPVVGYFLKDKFAVGLNPSLIYGSNNVANSNTIITIGPFVRYYFLKPENVFNLFTQGSYAYGNITGNGQSSSKSNTFSLSGGPVVYFNSSVGLEFILTYSTTRFIGFEGANNQIRFGIGFQIHLEKNK